MNYVKKMCILRQIKHGFSGDGKALSGLIKAEQYGKNLAVEISIINFAPLISGEYYCLLSDGKGKTEMLALRGKSIFNILSDIDISGGFCGIICYVKNEVVPIAYGINGNGSYDWRAILNATLPPVFPRGDKRNVAEETAKTSTVFASETKNGQGRYEMNAVLSDNNAELLPADLPPEIQKEESVSIPPSLIKNEEKPALEDAYNDERMATENYYEEKNNERKQLQEISDYAYAQSAAKEQNEKAGPSPSADGNAEDVLHPFKTDSDGYYNSVKAEIDELFASYPSDETLNDAFSCSKWVRVKGEAHAPEYLVGVLYNDGKAKYICYALRAEDPEKPPEEIKNSCTFVPISIYDESEGFFIIFQSAATGECVKPERI